VLNTFLSSWSLTMEPMDPWPLAFFVMAEIQQHPPLHFFSFSFSLFLDQTQNQFLSASAKNLLGSAVGWWWALPLQSSLNVLLGSIGLWVPVCLRFFTNHEKARTTTTRWKVELDEIKALESRFLFHRRFLRHNRYPLQQEFGERAETSSGLLC
jgi:hypothetical protein